jgi:hypothetical protein
MCDLTVALITCLLYGLLAGIRTLLQFVPHLEMLEMYATHLNGNEERFLRSGFSMATDLAEKYSRYDHLVSHVYVTAPSLQKVKCPRGWWNRPKIELLSVAERERDLKAHEMCCPNGPQPGANTGPIADFSDFIQLQTLITHSTAITAADWNSKTVANPCVTIPPSIAYITVYGAHNGL